MAASAELANTDHLSLASLPLPLAVRLPNPISDEELRAFAAKIEPYRVERNAQGELEIMTPLNTRGGRWESYVIGQLDLWAEQHGGASFSSSGGFNLPDGSMRCADAAWISQERWEALTDEQRDTFAPVCPEFVIKIRSKTDSRTAPEKKMQMWIANGTQLAWLIDPQSKSVSVYRADHGTEMQNQPEALTADSVVPGFQLAMAKFWIS